VTKEMKKRHGVKETKPKRREPFTVRLESRAIRASEPALYFSAPSRNPETDARGDGNKHGSCLVQLSRPRATNDPEGVLYVLHRCTAPIGPDSGRVVRMAARGGAPPSMAALYSVLTKALGRKGQPPVVAVMTAAGKAVTSPSQVRVRAALWNIPLAPFACQLGKSFQSEGSMGEAPFSADEKSPDGLACGSFGQSRGSS